MSSNSFGMLCDDWVRENPEYNIEWSYDLGGKFFNLDINSKEIDAENRRQIIKTKATIPNVDGVNGKVVAYVMNLLRCQLDLYRDFGIKI